MKEKRKYLDRNIITKDDVERALRYAEGGSADDKARRFRSHPRIRRGKELDEEAAQLIYRVPSGELTFEIERLSEAAAEGLAKFTGCAIGLNRIDEIDAKVAKALASFQGDDLVLGLKGTLTLEVAQELANFGGHLCLTEIESLDPGILENLKEISCSGVEFRNLWPLSDEELRAFGKISNRIHHQAIRVLDERILKAGFVFNSLFNIPKISDDVVEHDRFSYLLEKKLSSGSPSKTTYWDLQSVGPRLAKCLVEYCDGIAIELPRVKELLPESAAHLAAHEGALDLSGLYLTSELEEAFAEYKGPKLVLGSIRSIDSQNSKLLSLGPRLSVRALRHVDGAHFRSGIEFNLESATTLTTSAAEELVEKHDGKWLRLSGIKKLTEPTARILAKHSGHLDLDGIEELTEPIARRLAEHSGDLNLSRVSQLTVEAAQFLAKYNGRSLNLSGLQSTDAEIYRILLERETGSLDLPGACKPLLTGIEQPDPADEINTILEKTQAIWAEYIYGGKVTRDMTPYDDLGWDFLDVFEFIAACEEAFGVDISEEDQDSFFSESEKKTFYDIAHRIHELQDIDSLARPGKLWVRFS